MRKSFERRSARWWAVSVVVHVFAAVVLAQLMFRYPLGQLMGIRKSDYKQERLLYIALPQQAGGGKAKTPSAGAAPAALRAPSVVPTQVPVPDMRDSSRSQSAGGSGAGTGDAGAGAATGISPRQPDSRIALSPTTAVRRARTVEESVDSIVSLAIGIVQDSIAIASGQRKPGDWTVKGKDGQVWGWDPSGNIRLGKFTIPGALLALLPLNKGQSPINPIEQRSLAYIRRDVLENAQRSINEDEFRAAVKRIRERKERERRQNQLAADTKGEPREP